MLYAVILPCRSVVVLEKRQISIQPEWSPMDCQAAEKLSTLCFILVSFFLHIFN